MPLHEEFISTKFKSLDKVPNSILPNYSGYGLTSLVPSVGRWLGSKALPSPAFGEDILRHFENRYRRVVVLLVDALGYNQLLHLMEEGYADFWRKKLDEGHLFPHSNTQRKPRCLAQQPQHSPRFGRVQTPTNTA